MPNRLFQALKKNNSQTQFLRFVLVGITVNVLLYVIYIELTSSGLGPKISASVIYFFGIAINFFAHKKVTFANTLSNKQQWLPFIALSLSVYAINIAGLYVLVDKLHLTHQIVQGFMIVVCAFISFTVQKIAIFKVGK